jgi:hypothetical protein
MAPLPVSYVNYSVCYNQNMAKRKVSSNKQPEWMRDNDLAKTILMILVSILGLYFILLPIYFKEHPKGFLYLLYPFYYVFSLYQSASPGEKLSAIFLLFGGLGGWFLKQWTANNK